MNSIYVDGTTVNGITGDGSPYVNGQSGVAATIKVCTGTNDAVLELASSSRTLSFSFARMLASNKNTPAWANGIVSGQGLLNIKHIVFVPTGYTRADEYTFTTRMGSRPPAKGSWNLRMFYPTTDAISDNDGVTEANAPYTDTIVHVKHCPANSTATCGPCVAIVHETWYVYPDQNLPGGFSAQTGLPLFQVGGLVDTQTPTGVNAGQFSMPFSFVISVLQ